VASGELGDQHGGRGSPARSSSVGRARSCAKWNGEEVRVRAVLKKELGCMGGRRGRGSRCACASARVLVHGGARGRQS
jgi:hypothetical protein